MKKGIKHMLLTAFGFLVGVTVAYVITANDALGSLAMGSGIVTGAAFGLFSHAFFAQKTGPETERARAGARPAKSQELLRTVIDGMPDVTIVINRHHRVVLVNRAAREMAGGIDPVARGLPCHRFSHHSNAPCEGLAEPCPLSEIVRTKRPVTVTHTHYGPDDNEIIAEVRATPVFDDAGEVVQIIEACRDITRRKHASVTLRTG